MTSANGWVPITKAEKQADGTLIVEGLASDSGIDRDKQIADPGWLAKAMPAWFRDGGNIREQHDPKRAAGVAIHYAETDQGHHIRAHIVDPVTALKVETGVLKGFSFGARNARVTTDKSAVGGRIVGGDIYEVSVVDRPANPRCALTIAKADKGGDLHVVDNPELIETGETVKVEGSLIRPSDLARMLKALKIGGDKDEAEETDEETEDAEGEGEEEDEEETEQGAKQRGKETSKTEFSTDQRERLAEENEAMPDGSYPIRNRKDLGNAIQSFGRAKNKAKVKAWIIRRARALGAVDTLPEDWNVTKAIHAVDALAKTTDLSKLDMGIVDLSGNPDIPAAKDVIAGIAELVVSEARGLADGDMTEIGDIRLLLEAACALQYYIACEARETGHDSNGETMASKTEKAVDETLVKTVSDDTDGDGMISKTELSALITDVVTKAVASHEAEIASLRDELAEVKALPVPGGPVRTRTTAATAVAQKADAHRREADRFERLADQIGNGDLAKGYRDLATLELAKADALTS